VTRPVLEFQRADVLDGDGLAAGERLFHGVQHALDGQFHVPANKGMAPDEHAGMHAVDQF